MLILEIRLGRPLKWHGRYLLMLMLGRKPRGPAAAKAHSRLVLPSPCIVRPARLKAIVATLMVHGILSRELVDRTGMFMTLLVSP